MKKLFILAATVMASVSMSAAVTFTYLPGEAAGFTESDSLVAEKTVFIDNDCMTVKNAYESKYKLVGMMTDTAYAALRIGDVTVDYTRKSIQGTTNPTAGGGNPVLDMKAPNAGSCFYVEPKKDGYIYVAVKTTLNKQQFVFQGVVEQNGQVAGYQVGYDYLTMANPAKFIADNVGKPVPGAISVRVVGQGEINKLLAPSGMINAIAGTNLSVNGVGAMVFKVRKGVNYLVGTAGSKMMACGFGFSEEMVEVEALGSKNIDHTTEAGAKVTEDNYDNVILSKEENFFTQTYDEQPILVRVALPTNEPANDTTNIWSKYKVDKRDANGNPTAYKLNANIYAWVWGTKKDDTKEEGKWLQAAKSGNYYVLQIDGMKEVNLVLNADGAWGDANHQTDDIKGITGDICVRVGDVPADKDTKCGHVMLDCLTGEEIKEGFENIEMDGTKAVKFIGNDGKLYIHCNGVVYNVLGTVVAE